MLHHPALLKYFDDTFFITFQWIEIIIITPNTTDVYHMYFTYIDDVLSPLRILHVLQSDRYTTLFYLCDRKVPFEYPFFHQFALSYVLPLQGVPGLRVVL